MPKTVFRTLFSLMETFADAEFCWAKLVGVEGRIDSDNMARAGILSATSGFLQKLNAKAPCSERIYGQDLVLGARLRKKHNGELIGQSTISYAAKIWSLFLEKHNNLNRRCRGQPRILYVSQEVSCDALFIHSLHSSSGSNRHWGRRVNTTYEKCERP